MALEVPPCPPSRGNFNPHSAYEPHVSRRNHDPGADIPSCHKHLFALARTAFRFRRDSSHFGGAPVDQCRHCLINDAGSKFPRAAPSHLAYENKKPPRSSRNRTGLRTHRICPGGRVGESHFRGASQRPSARRRRSALCAGGGLSAGGASARAGDWVSAGITTLPARRLCDTTSRSSWQLAP